MELDTGAGDISVERAFDGAEITTGSGAVHVGSIAGAGVIKNSNGDTWVGEVTGDLRVQRGQRQDFCRAGACRGGGQDCQWGCLPRPGGRGAILAQTACGKIDVGIRDGVAAWLELSTSYGNVHNHLEAAQRPAPTEDSVEIRARSSFGDVAVHRSRSSGSQMVA